MEIDYNIYGNQITGYSKTEVTKGNLIETFLSKGYDINNIEIKYNIDRWSFSAYIEKIEKKPPSYKRKYNNDFDSNYNAKIKDYLDELGLKVSALSPIFGISKDMISQKFMPNYPRPPFTEQDFYKIITYFKNKSNELYNNATKEQNTTN